MGFFQKLKWFLEGRYVCRECGETWFSFVSFGFGEIICPECYGKHNPAPEKWLFPDRTFWLNRVAFKP